MKRKPLEDITDKVASYENRMPMDNPGIPIQRTASDLSLASSFPSCTDDSGNDGDSETSYAVSDCSDDSEMSSSVLELGEFDIFTFFLPTISDILE